VPLVYELPCSLSGCRSRCWVSATSEQAAARCLNGLGWRVDEESEGFLCDLHFEPTAPEERRADA
jgi:hypothetical protein